MQNPNNPKTKRTTKVLIAILVGLAIIIAALCATPFVLAATVREFRTINDVPAPTQTKVEVGTATVSGSGWKANMRYLASYEIQGLVVGLDDYNSGSLYDRAAPRDLSIAWGDMAAHSNLIVWLRGQREMSAEITKMSEWIIGKKYDELVTQYSNNHLIPKDQKILAQIKNVKRGDYVKLKGYLVDLILRDTSEPSVYYELKSSLTRDDTGDNACEVMYVTDVELLD